MPKPDSRWKRGNITKATSGHHFKVLYGCGRIREVISRWWVLSTKEGRVYRHSRSTKTNTTAYRVRICTENIALVLASSNSSGDAIANGSPVPIVGVSDVINRKFHSSQIRRICIPLYNVLDRCHNFRNGTYDRRS